MYLLWYSMSDLAAGLGAILGLPQKSQQSLLRILVQLGQIVRATRPLIQGDHPVRLYRFAIHVRGCKPLPFEGQSEVPTEQSLPGAHGDLGAVCTNEVL